MAADRVIRWTTAGAVAGVAAMASYEHAYALVRAHGEAGRTGRPVPLTMDGLIYVTSIVSSRGATSSLRHADETINLVGAMQFLGYRHVIATMWTISDAPAPSLADSFYTALSQDGKPDPDRAAEALHHAVRRLRQAYPANPQLWAPYIHL